MVAYRAGDSTFHFYSGGNHHFTREGPHNQSQFPVEPSLWRSCGVLLVVMMVMRRWFLAVDTLPEVTGEGLTGDAAIAVKLAQILRQLLLGQL